MQNLTFQHLFLSFSLHSPLLSSMAKITVSKSSFSYFFYPTLHCISHSHHFSTTRFTNFLSSAIVLTTSEEIIYTNQNFINQRPNFLRNDIYINKCFFKDCVVPYPSANGGAISANGNFIEINNTAFISCNSTVKRSCGGAVWVGCPTTIMSNVCAKDCNAVDEGQSIYILKSNIYIEYLSIATSGKNVDHSGADSIYVTGQSIIIKNLNSTGNIVRNGGAGLNLNILSNPSSRPENNVANLTFCTFFKDFGTSILFFSIKAKMNIENVNFISNSAAISVISMIGTKDPRLSNCIFQSNIGTIAKPLSDASTIKVNIIDSFIDVANWGSASTSNCVVKATSALVIPFFKSAVCDGYIPSTPKKTPSQTPVPRTLDPDKPIPTPGPVDTGSSSAEETMYTDINESQFEYTSEDIIDINETINECVDLNATKKMSVGNIVAIVFCVIEAICLIALSVLTYFLWKKLKSDPSKSNQNPKDQNGLNDQNVQNDQKSTKDDNKSDKTPPKEVDQNEINLDDISLERNNNEDNKPSHDQSSNETTPQRKRKKRKINRDQNDPYSSGTYSTPHAPRPPQPPRASTRSHRVEEPEITPQVQRQRQGKRKSPRPIDERSPLIDNKQEKHTSSIVFSSSDSD